MRRDGWLPEWRAVDSALRAWHTCDAVTKIPEEGVDFDDAMKLLIADRDNDQRMRSVHPVLTDRGFFYRLRNVHTEQVIML